MLARLYPTSISISFPMFIGFFHYYISTNSNCFAQFRHCRRFYAGNCVSLSRRPAGKGFISLLAVGSHDRSVSFVGIVSSIEIGGLTMQNENGSG